jgi:hypothetical protein
MTVSRIDAYNNEVYRRTEIKRSDCRHEQIRLEEMRIKERLKNSEEKRIEMNQRMNRPGQNIDRMA